MPYADASSLPKPGPGRPKGKKDSYPRSKKATILSLMAKIVENEPELIEKAIRAGLEAKPPISHHYIQLAHYSLDGKPIERVQMQADVQAQVKVEHVLTHRPKE